MVKIYQFVGTFEFYEISNYIWILYGIFLLICKRSITECLMYCSNP